MTKKPRAERKYVATKGQLTQQFRQFPNRQAPKNSRPVLESGTAVKTVYLSKAPIDWDREKLEKALESHEKRMFIELQDSGRIVRKVIKTLAGMEGDVRIQMVWEILGTKNTKAYRKTLKEAKLGANASPVGAIEAGQNEPGRTEAQPNREEGPVPL